MTHDPLCVDFARTYRARICVCGFIDIVRRQERQQQRQRNLRGRIDAIGTRRRLQALSAIGWTQTHLADELEVSVQSLHQLATDERRTVTAVTAERVRELYDRLSMTPGPSAMARTTAKRNGWAPPLAWDDDTIDDPDAEPEGVVTRRVGVNPHDVLEAYREGHPIEGIAHRFGLAPKSVQKYIARARAEVAS